MTRSVLITGATAGIGEASAKLFAKEGYRLIITGRREDRLNTLSELLKKEFQSEVLTLSFDVRDNNAVQTSISKISNDWKNIDILINNAGLAAGRGPIDEGNLDDWEQMIDTNLKGLLYVSKAIIPFMKNEQKGHIINIGSIAGKETYKDGNVYCATKHAVDSLTKAMRIDLLPYNIKVTGVCPGAVDTEFSLVRYKGDKNQAKAVYKGFDPLLANDIAEAIYFAASRPAHVNINDLVIMPSAQANTSHLRKDI